MNVFRDECEREKAFIVYTYASMEKSIRYHRIPKYYLIGENAKIDYAARGLKGKQQQKVTKTCQIFIYLNWDNLPFYKEELVKMEMTEIRVLEEQLVESNVLIKDPEYQNKYRVNFDHPVLIKYREIVLNEKDPSYDF